MASKLSEQIHRLQPAARRKPSTIAAFIGAIIAFANFSCAFLFPTPSTNVALSPPILQQSGQLHSHNRRHRARLRSPRLFVSLAPDQPSSASPLETIHSHDMNVSTVEENNITSCMETDKGNTGMMIKSVSEAVIDDQATESRHNSNAVNISLAADVNFTESVVFSSEVANVNSSISLTPVEDLTFHDDKNLFFGVGDEKLAQILSHDKIDMEQFVSPAIPVSYDEQGMVQADTIPSSVSMAMKDGLLLSPIGGTAFANKNESEDYPQFIKFLFKKDENGQTFASKIFNLTLLAVSFGYVILSVVNIDHGMTRGWTPTEIGMRIPLDTWASYENSLSEKPVATKTIINIVIYLLGDWLSQTIFQKKNFLNFDAARTLKNGFVGMCFGPAVHEYYEFSDWILPVDGMTLGITNRAFKILMDQTIYLSVKCSIYIMAIGVLNGASVEESSENVKNRIKPIMFTAWRFWPLVHCVTYGLIPARHRILWVNSVDLVWNAILASKARDDGVAKKEDGEEYGNEGGARSDEGFNVEKILTTVNSRFGWESPKVEKLNETFAVPVSGMTENFVAEECDRAVNETITEDLAVVSGDP
mmetsp:Transcript_24231/g.51150  ORF Transcript_24231/g.51150 Transcript_24231/m.51150 type:complete len:589 (-) Transcript_24231:1192-2958(-)